MAELSRPKPDHMPEWNRPHGMQVAWRNQQPLKPVKIFDKAPNKRLLELAKPRKRHDQPILYQYTCGQPDGISKPCLETKQRCMSARLDHLSKPIIRHCWNNQRDDDEIKISKTISIARLTELSKPRTSYARPTVHVRPTTAPARFSRSSCMPCPEHIENLAKPKRKQVKFDSALRRESTVAPGALKYKISSRIAELAKPSEQINNECCADDTEFFKVRQSALTGNFAQNVDDLAKPLVRQSMDAAQFNPNAFQISDAAKKAQPSRRITELAKPSRSSDKL